MLKTQYFIVAATVLSSLSAFGAEKLGLKPLSPKELRSMQKNLGMRRIKKVKPNSLGLKRINKERVRRGLAPYSTSSASSLGKDTEIDSTSDFDFESMGAMETSSSEILLGALPTTVDNSLLPSFPLIGNQSVNNCVAWAMGYYQHTHNNGLALGWANNNTDKTKKCSPKFIYNLINKGSDNGSSLGDAASVLQKHGCVNLADFPEDSNFRAWNTNPDHWQKSLSTRSNALQYVYNVDTQAGLDQIKQLLNNGYLLTFGTYIYSWQNTTIKSNPAASSSPLAGKQVLRYMNGTNGGHAMTIVGYDDNAWVDINNNNVVNAGELGVLKIANSWGTAWGHSGFIYISYDALKSVSAVSGGPSSGRIAAFQSKTAFHIPVKASNGVSYSPKYLAKFTLNHAARNQLSLKFGWSPNGYSSPTSTFIPGALINQGGAYAFNGTTTPVSSTFIMDISDLPINSTDNKIYLTMSDSTSGNPATLSSFEVINVKDGTQSALNLSKSTDASSTTVALNFVPSIANQNPVASFSASTTSGVAPLAIDFDGAASSDPDGTISSYSWDFGDGTTATGPYVSKTYSSAGTFTVKLTVKDNDGATATSTKTITSTTSVDTTRPYVSLTNPLNGARYARYSTVTAKAKASDNVKVVKVKFYVNGYLKCTDYTVSYSRYSCSFKMPLGTKVPVRAWAYDAAGNYKVSSTIYISN